MNDKKLCVVNYEMLPLSMRKTLEVKEILKKERVSVKEAYERVGLKKATYFKWKDNIDFLKKI